MTRFSVTVSVQSDSVEEKDLLELLRRHLSVDVDGVVTEVIPESLRAAEGPELVSSFVVLEIFKSKAQQAFYCSSYDDAVDIFSKLVSEYGVEPYEEMINDNIFREDGEEGSTVQILPVL